MGLGELLSNLWTSARGRIASLFSRSTGPLSLEKVRTAGAFGTLQFLPMHDGVTDETVEMRAEYPKMLKDEAVKSSLCRKIDSVAALDWQVHPEDQSDPQARAQADFCDWMAERMEGGKPAIVHDILMGALILGHSVGEKVWDLDPIPTGRWKGRYRYRALKSKDPRYAQLSIDEFKNIIAVRGTGWNSGRVFDPADFVIYTHFPLWDNPQGMSDLRAAYRYYVIKNNLWLLRAIYLEKYSAGGLMKGKYSRNELRASLETALAAAKANTYVCLPDGTEMDLIDLATRGGNDFKAAIEDCNQGIVVGISGAFLQALEGQTNNGAGNSSVHKDTADLAVWRLSQAVAFVITHQLFPDPVRLNFGPDAQPPLLTLGAVDDADLAPALAVDKGLSDLGLKLSKKELYKRYGRSEPNDPADVLEPKPSQPGGPGGAPGALPFCESPAQEVPAQPFRGGGNTRIRTIERE